jgi:signal transduction histidine kinase
VFTLLNRHVQQLLGVNFFCIAMMDSDGLALNSVFALDDGKPMPLFSFPLSDADSKIARCARERRELLIDFDLAREDPYWYFSSTPTLSRLFVPLCLADEVLGVVTVQSRRRHAYGAPEQMILGTLCAYATIALSNAAAHGELTAAHTLLQETQQQLVMQGKMAGLGTLTAGVAHEINNPTNFVHVAVQNQRADIAEFESFIAGLLDEDAEPEILDAFQQRFERLTGNVGTMLNGTERIKNIVKDLPAFTRQDLSEKESVRLSGCLTSTLNLVRTSWQNKVEFITEFNDDPEVECWPALLNQVFMNLLVNGCQAIDETLQAASGHTGCDMPGQERAKLWLRLKLSADECILLIAFEDSGIGIDAATQARIMEPFYTTKPVGVGYGVDDGRPMPPIRLSMSGNESNSSLAEKHHTADNTKNPRSQCEKRGFRGRHRTY